MRRDREIRLLLVLLGSAASGAASAGDWLQFGYDAAHSSSNPQGGYTLPAGNGYASGFTSSGVALSSSTDSTPVLATGIVTGSGTKDLLFIEAKNGTLLALDAATGTQVWAQRPNTQLPPPSTGLASLSTGSPAIDAAKQYIYHYGNDGAIHKYAIGTGVEVTGGGWPELSTYKPEVEKGAAALTIASTPSGTFLYSVTDGYVGDAGDYQGHLTAINLVTGTQKVFNSECSNQTVHLVKRGAGVSGTTCSSAQNGIWGRPGAIYDAGTNRVFISTGNGPYNANSGGFEWGDSVLALNPDGSGSATPGMPVDSYTPSTFQNLQNTDADLGSVSVALIPAPAGTAAAYQHLGVQPGKDGCVRLINLADMSGAGAPAHTGGELSAIDLPGGANCATGSDGPEIKPQPAVWVNPSDGSSWAFVTSYGNGMAAYKIVLDGSGKPSLAQQWTGASGTSPVISGGQLYYLSGGRVVARDAVTGTSIWSSIALSSIHWQSLIVLNGKIYAIDGASKLFEWQMDGIFRSKFE